MSSVSKRDGRGSSTRWTFLKRVGNSFTLRHPLTLGRRASTAERYLENIETTETTAPRLLPDSQGSIMGAMNLGFPEMMFIFLLALIIFGPKKLPEIGRQIGKALNEFRRASNEFKAQIEAEINQLDVETRTQQILPPGRSPEGAIAAGSREEATATNPEIKSKVQDA